MIIDSENTFLTYALYQLHVPRTRRQRTGLAEVISGGALRGDPMLLPGSAALGTVQWGLLYG